MLTLFALSAFGSRCTANRGTNVTHFQFSATLTGQIAGWCVYANWIEKQEWVSLFMCVVLWCNAWMMNMRKSMKLTVRFNVPIQQRSRYQQYLIPSYQMQHEVFLALTQTYFGAETCDWGSALPSSPGEKLKISNRPWVEYKTTNSVSAPQFKYLICVLEKKSQSRTF